MDRLALPLRAALILLAVSACGPVAAQPADERVAEHARLREALTAGRLEEAAAHAATVVSLTEARFGAASRELVNPLTNAGTVAFRRGDLAAAEDYAADLDADVPVAVKGRVLRAAIRGRQGRYAEAEALLVEALRLDPDSVEARRLLTTVREAVTEIGKR